MVTLAVRSNRIGPVRGRHPWVFSGALVNIPEGIKNGEPVTLTDEAGKFLAHGYFNSYSQIAVRLWSWEETETVNGDFFKKRVSQAFDLRKKYVASDATNAYRLINGENDLLPGLIVDKYADTLAVQFHTAGIAAWKDQVIQALVAVIAPVGIYERSDVTVHKNTENGLERTTGLLYGQVNSEIEIKENNWRFLVNVQTGQKTGFFLDQRDKRQALAKYAAGKRVLNCFAYTGGFSVYALGGGAVSVTSVDASIPALEMAEKNVALNNFDVSKTEFIAADVKDYLADREHNEFDVIILDPPAFIKDRRKIKEGLSGYKKINTAAIRLLPPGGILVTASCSAHLSLADFRYCISESAGAAGRTLQILETFTHGADHPELAAYTEGDYLKCFFARVL